jgi:hypothetical protein
MPAEFDPQTLLAKAARGALRHGEVEALSMYVRRLERECASAQVVREAAARDQHLLLALTPEGSFAVTFPGLKHHTVTLPPGPIALDFLLKTLRERSGRAPSYVASPGAPTQADLQALAKLSKIKPKKPGLDLDMTLEDIL